MWHSESEANWTSYNPMKDITQSQVLSSVDDEQKQSPNDHEHLGCSRQHFLSDTPHAISPNLPLQHKETLSPFTEDEDEMPSRGTLEARASRLQEESQQHGWEEANMEESVYGFESPRPVNIFGPSSWNSLCLAVNKNLVTQSELYGTTPCHTDCVCVHARTKVSLLGSHHHGNRLSFLIIVQIDSPNILKHKCHLVFETLSSKTVHTSHLLISRNLEQPTISKNGFIRPCIVRRTQVGN